MSKLNSIKSKNFNEIQISKEPTFLTGQNQLDEWFSSDGGIVAGSAIYVSGTSGAGKTTLMVSLMKWLKDHKTSMYLREMEGKNVKFQLKDLEGMHSNAYFCDINDCATFEDYMKEIEILKPKVIILDSLQVIAKEDYEMNGVSEDVACYTIIKTLREWISKNDATLFLIGHNTKDGNFAGKNTIIQMMDCHMAMTFYKKEDKRILEWGQKNRKGPMGEIEYFIDNGGIKFNKEGTEPTFFDVWFDNTMKFLTKKSNKNADFKKEAQQSLSLINEQDLSEEEYMNLVNNLTYKLSNKYAF